MIPVASNPMQIAQDVLLIPGQTTENFTKGTVVFKQLSDLGITIPSGYKCIAVMPNYESQGGMWYQLTASPWPHGISFFPQYTWSNITVHVNAVCVKDS